MHNVIKVVYLLIDFWLVVINS